MDYLKKLNETCGGRWMETAENTYKRTVEGATNESLQVVKNGKVWIVAFCVDDKPVYAHDYPSFKQLVAAISS